MFSEGDGAGAGGITHPAGLVFVFGLAIYLFIQIGLVAGPILSRPVPPGTTDAYVYISKAEQLRSCPRQRCPALADLHAQAAPAAKGAPLKIARQRSLTYQRALYQYHLLHSGVLAGLKEIGLSYEFAINLVSVAGALLIAGGVAWLLVAAFGAGPAGLALGVLGFAVYPGYHGLHWVVPSTIALGLGLIAWAAAIARPRGLGALLLVLVLAMVWMHPIGRVHALAALALYLVLAPRRGPGVWVVVVAGLAVVATPTIAAVLLERPALSYNGIYGGDGWGFLAGLTKNLDAAYWAARPWLIERGGIAVLVLAAIGLAVAERRRRRRIVVLAGLTAGLLAASLAYVLPRYPAELFHRLWIPFAVTVTGLAAYGAWRGGQRLLAQRDGAGRWFRMVARPLVAVIGAALVVVVAVGAVANGSRAALRMARYMTSWGVMPLDRGQPARVLPRILAGSRIAYLDELSYFLYASKGALARGAVFDPAVASTPLARRYYGRDGRVALTVAARDGFYGFVPLTSGRPIVIRASAAIDWSRALLNVETRNRTVVLELRVLGAGASARPRRLTVAADRGGWVRLGLPAGTTGRALAIARRSDGPLAWIQGVRIDPASRLTWPWDVGVTVLQWKVAATLDRAIALVRAQPATGAFPAKKIASHAFRSATLVPAGCRNLGIVEDFGATVASLTRCGDGQGAGGARRKKP